MTSIEPHKNSNANKMVFVFTPFFFNAFTPQTVSSFAAFTTDNYNSLYQSASKIIFFITQKNIPFTHALFILRNKKRIMNKAFVNND